MEQVAIEKEMFGKTAEIVLFDVDNDIAQSVLGDAYLKGLQLQKIFNLYDTNSELCRLNKTRRMRVSRDLLFVLNKAISFCQMSGGEYDVAFGNDIIARKEGKSNSRTKKNSYVGIEMSSDGYVTLQMQEIFIDLGSIAKGHIVDKMVECLKKEGVLSGLVDGRGDIRVFGKEQVIGIQHPRKKDGLIASIALKDQAVATSGDYNQFHKTHKNSHIINSKDLVSVTVVADDLMTADAFATVIFVSSKKSRERLLKTHKKIKAMMVDDTMAITYANGFERILRG